MAGDLEDSKGLGLFERGGWVWFFLHVVVFFVLVFIVDSAWLQAQTMDEARGFGVIVGDLAAVEVFDRSVVWYDTLITSNDYEARLRNFIFPPDGGSGSERAMRNMTGTIWTHVDIWLENFWVLVFQALYRVNVLGYWLLFTFPLVIAMFVDGLNVRAIKRHEFGWSSVNIFRMGAYMFSMAPSFLTLYLMLPIVPVFAHLVPVLFVLGVAFGVRLMSAHFMRYL